MIIHKPMGTAVLTFIGYKTKQTNKLCILLDKSFNYGIIGKFR